MCMEIRHSVLHHAVAKFWTMSSTSLMAHLHGTSIRGRDPNLPPRSILAQVGLESGVFGFYCGLHFGVILSFQEDSATVQISGSDTTANCYMGRNGILYEGLGPFEADPAPDIDR